MAISDKLEQVASPLPGSLRRSGGGDDVDATGLPAGHKPLPPNLSELGSLETNRLSGVRVPIAWVSWPSQVDILSLGRTPVRLYAPTGALACTGTANYTSRGEASRSAFGGGLRPFGI